MHSLPDVCDVRVVRGARGSDVPDLVLEVPHGVTRRADFDRLRGALRGPFPDELRDFFFVNTDVGAPELALAIAQHVVAGDPGRTAAVLRCLVPRTFVDCNRVIDAAAGPQRSAAGEVTPGVHAWVRDPLDVAHLLDLYGAYRALVEQAVAEAVARGGGAWMVHTYAPRSIDVPVDEEIVRRLREAYAPGNLERWPLRPSVDLIVDTPDGRRLADPALVERVRARLADEGFDVALGGAYALHPATLAAHLAARHPGRTLCFEVRRDLLVREFTPFDEMHVDPMKVDRVAAPLAGALLDAPRPLEPPR